MKLKSSDIAHYTKRALNRVIFIAMLVTIGFKVFGQSATDFDFPKIFGQGINYNDTSMTLPNKTTIVHSTATCSMKAFKKNEKLKWTTDLPKTSCEIMYFKLLENKKIKNSDILIQLDDTTIKGFNSKTGKMISISGEELEVYRTKQERN